MKDIRTIVEGIAHLKPFPQSLHQVMGLAQDPETDANSLSEAISRDPSLTANLLKDANSAYYGRSRKIETAHQAVVFLPVATGWNESCRAGFAPAEKTAPCHGARQSKIKLQISYPTKGLGYIFFSLSFASITQ